MSRVPDGKTSLSLKMNDLKNILQIPVSLFPCRINVCVCVCLTESGYFILLAHSGRGHHLLAVKSLGGDLRLN